MSQPPAGPVPAESRGETLAYKLGFGARRRAEVSQQFRERHAAAVLPPMVKTPLTTSQHILHLLLSVLTLGLWIPVWIIRAISGNMQAAPPPQPSWAYPPPQGYPQQWGYQPPQPGYAPPQQPQAPGQHRGQ